MIKKSSKKILKILCAPPPFEDLFENKYITQNKSLEKIDLKKKGCGKFYDFHFKKII